ncbi:MAG: hypothetical protein AMS24_01915 [Chlamydiae bacterium SM23_39]|nr:MAG: hypothetical protein AMS24_01915 [Chlamydiae bacterium SM23_39]
MIEISKLTEFPKVSFMDFWCSCYKRKGTYLDPISIDSLKQDKQNCEKSDKDASFNDRKFFLVNEKEKGFIVTSKNASLLIGPMSSRIRKIAEQNKILVECKKSTPTGCKNSLNESEKDIMNQTEVWDRSFLGEMGRCLEPEQQEKLAKDIATIIKKSGLITKNIEFERNYDERDKKWKVKKIIFFNPEPKGLMFPESEKDFRYSVEKCGLIGLELLIGETKEKAAQKSSVPTFQSFLDQIEKEYSKYKKEQQQSISTRLKVAIVAIFTLKFIRDIIQAFKKTKQARKLLKELESISNDKKFLGEEEFKEIENEKKNYERLQSIESEDDKNKYFKNVEKINIHNEKFKKYKNLLEKYIILTKPVFS